MNEVWLVISEFPNYEISNSFKVRRKGSGKPIKILTNDNDCDYVNICKDGKSYSRSLGKLVDTAFNV